MDDEWDEDMNEIWPTCCLYTLDYIGTADLVVLINRYTGENASWLIRTLYVCCMKHLFTNIELT